MAFSYSLKIKTINIHDTKDPWLMYHNANLYVFCNFSIGNQSVVELVLRAQCMFSCRAAVLGTYKKWDCTGHHASGGPALGQNREKLYKSVNVMGIISLSSFYTILSSKKSRS